MPTVPKPTALSDPSPRPKVDSSPAAEASRWPSPTESRGRRGGYLVWLIVVVVIAAVGVYAYGALTSSGRSALDAAILTTPVERGELLITVTEDGAVESAVNIDLKCEVAGGSTILYIVADGEIVKKGQKLVELDSSSIEDQISQQRINYEKARSTMIQSEKEYAVAQISVQEYEEGNYVQQLQDLNAQVTVALENLKSAENGLTYGERMFRKGYISPLELESQQFAVQRAELELASARTAVDVLQKFTKAKTMEDLTSQRETAQARMLSDKAAFELEEDRLKRLEVQLAKCVIVAPADGMAVYANDQSRQRFGGGGQQQTLIEEGALVREQQSILRLPDLAKMQVKVAVHESRVDQLEPGMLANVSILGQQFHGTVLSIANQPEAASFLSANVKEYATIVKIDGEPKGLKPGMTAQVEILVQDLSDVLTVPVAAIVELGGKFYAWADKDGNLEKRPLVLGPTNDKLISITDGLAEGEPVVLNPRTVIPEAREERSNSQGRSAQSVFGQGGPGGRRGPAGAPGGGPRDGGGGRAGRGADYDRGAGGAAGARDGAGRREGRGGRDGPATSEGSPAPVRRGGPPGGG